MDAKAGKIIMNRRSMDEEKAAIAIILIAIIATSTVMFLQKSQTTQAALISPNPPSGCVGWWHFDEGTGTITADSSGNGNNGALQGSPRWVAGKYGDALSLVRLARAFMFRVLHKLPLQHSLCLYG